MPATSDLDDEQLVLLLKQGREKAVGVIISDTQKSLLDKFIRTNCIKSAYDRIKSS